MVRQVFLVAAAAAAAAVGAVEFLGTGVDVLRVVRLDHREGRGDAVAVAGLVVLLHLVALAAHGHVLLRAADQLHLFQGDPFSFFFYWIYSVSSASLLQDETSR